MFKTKCLFPCSQLLGRKVYASNNQLGGVQIMFNNGVSHKTEGELTFLCKQKFDEFFSTKY